MHEKQRRRNYTAASSISFTALCHLCCNFIAAGYQHGKAWDWMFTFTPKELLEAAGHHAGWHHPPHAMWRLVSPAWLCLHRPWSVGLLHKMMKMLSVAAISEHAQEVLSQKSAGTARKEHRCVL